MNPELVALLDRMTGNCSNFELKPGMDPDEFRRRWNLSVDGKGFARESFNDPSKFVEPETHIIAA